MIIIIIESHTYQITQCVMIIIASLVAIKKSRSGLPAGPNLPNAVPNTTLNITTPSTFVVAVFDDLKFHRCNGTINEIEFKEKPFIQMIAYVIDSLKSLRDSFCPFGRDNSVDDCTRKKRRRI